MLGALGVAALLPATAGAAVKTVFAGLPPSTNKIAAKVIPGFKAFGNTYNPDANAFFRRKVTIHVGDSVKFVTRGFHTVDLPPAGAGDLPLLAPTGKLVIGETDAAGSPFWFDGKLPQLGLTPALLARSGPSTHPGARIDSGLPLGPAKPLVVKFTKAGTYKYYCDVHAGMIGYVTVKPRTATIPTARQDSAALVAQLVGAAKTALKLAKTALPAHTVDLGVGAPDGLELFTMFPSTLTVNAGTVVKFQISPHSFETHTVTFGPAAYLTALVKAGQSPVPPGQFIYPSDPGPLALAANTHGNGFVSSGGLTNGAKQIPSSAQIRFTQPGTYRYVCLIHPFMRGTIIVK